MFTMCIGTFNQISFRWSMHNATDTYTVHTPTHTHTHTLTRHRDQLCLFMGGDGVIKAVMLSSHTRSDHTHSHTSMRMRMLLISNSGNY